MPNAPAIPDRYEVREQLHASGQLVRLRAFDRLPQQEVVLEFPGPEALRLLATSTERSRLLRDAQARAKVQHPGVQRLHTVLEDPTCPVLVLEPRLGEPLSDVLERRGRLDAREVVALGQRLASALDAVHRCGVVHRGVAATNVLITGDPAEAVLTGFVFAKPIDQLGQSSLCYRSEDTTAQRALPAHPAPEQLAGQPADARADVFALGCVLYECATGRPAFAAADAEWKDPQDPRHFADLPKSLAEIVLKCVRRSPAARFPTMLDVHDALAAVDVAAPRETARRPFVIAGAALAALAVLIAWRPWSGNSEPQPRPVQPPPVAPETVVYADRYDASWAVLIGIDYKDHPGGLTQLDNPVRDVHAIKDGLVALGWRDDGEHIQVLADGAATRRGIEEALRKVELAGGDDQLFVFFAGHGATHSNSTAVGYVLPWEATKNEAGGRGVDWMPVDDLTRLFAVCRAKHILIALDCCHAGAVFERTRDIGGNDRVQRASASGPSDLQGPAHVLMTSCSARKLASDGAEHSPFAEGFIRSLAAASNARVNSNAVFQELKTRMVTQQRPLRENRVPGDEFDFVFMKLPPR